MPVALAPTRGLPPGWPLQRPGPLYWINGKPGSGKSTLMRFLFAHEMTKKQLEAWAGDGVPVVRAGFFFWTSGSREQRSQTGPCFATCCTNFCQPTEPSSRRPFPTYGLGCSA